MLLTAAFLIGSSWNIFISALSELSASEKPLLIPTSVSLVEKVATKLGSVREGFPNPNAILRGIF